MTNLFNLVKHLLDLLGVFLVEVTHIRAVEVENSDDMTLEGDWDDELWFWDWAAGHMAFEVIDVI